MIENVVGPIFTEKSIEIKGLVNKSGFVTPPYRSNNLHGNEFLMHGGPRYRNKGSKMQDEREEELPSRASWAAHLKSGGVTETAIHPSGRGEAQAVRTCTPRKDKHILEKILFGHLHFGWKIETWQNTFVGGRFAVPHWGVLGSFALSDQNVGALTLCFLRNVYFFEGVHVWIGILVKVLGFVEFHFFNTSI